MEKFIEFEDIDFNRVKKINIICKDKLFSKALEEYILKFYRNRGLQKPQISILEHKRDGLSHELNIEFTDLNYEIIDSWKSNYKEPFKKPDGKYIFYHNSISYEKRIRVNVKIVISRQSEYYKEVTLENNDLEFAITDEAYISKEYSDIKKAIEMEKILPPIEDFAQKNLKNIDNYDLIYGTMDPIFKDFFSKRLIPISKEYIEFKMGFNEDFYKAQEYVKQARLEEALLIWEQIFSDETNPSYARGVAAYNIAVYKTIVRDYDSASLYFNWAEELEAIGLQEFEKF
ncbi:MAG TPA: DUF6340 family protein [Spirochaetota bacterium]|nr:DUF6340 family protein [Spirochaetota bacterium]HOL56219.1 DUF6340 family protein [Spirochaetota bacterium]